MSQGYADRTCCVCGEAVPHYKTAGQKNRPSFLTIYLTLFFTKASQGKPHQPCQKVPICQACLDAALCGPGDAFGPQASPFAGAILRSIRDRYKSMRGEEKAA